MSEPKVALTLRPYSQEPVPLDAEQLSRYLEGELRKIAVVVNALADVYHPSIVAGMQNPQGTFSIGLVAIPIINYDAQLLTEYADQLGLEIDRALGTITLGGDGSTFVTIEVSAFFTINRGALNQNQDIIIELSDGATLYDMGHAYIVENQQETLSIGRTILIRVASDAVMQLSIRVDGVADDTTFVDGFFTLDYVTGRDALLLA